MAEPTDSTTGQPEPGTIQDVTAQLARWSRFTPQGLARAEFISEFSRQEVVNSLRFVFAEQGIPFHEIELPVEVPAAQLITDLSAQLAALEPGVVSISGFATAFPYETPLEDSLTLLNFNRENLALHPHRQIWWMTPTFTQAFMQYALDLDSWFIVKMSLNQVVATSIPQAKKDLKRPEHFSPYSTLRNRYREALKRNATVPELLSIILPALKELYEVSEISEVRTQTNMILSEMTDAGKDVWDYFDQLPRAPTSYASIANGHLSYAVNMYNDLARNFLRTEQYRSAERAASLALHLSQSVLKQSDFDASHILLTLGRALRFQGKFNDAELILRLAVQADSKSLPPELWPDIGIDLIEFGLLLVDCKRYREAEIYLARGVRHLLMLGGNLHQARMSWDDFVTYLQTLGRTKEAQIWDSLIAEF